MGTDIHGVWQRRNQKNKVWEDVPCEWDQSRDYQLFAVLAGVRNGTGFAGIRTGEPVVPIAEPRGLPEDFAIFDRMHPIGCLDILPPWLRKFHTEEKPEFWMGDHSYSWLTGMEMLAWYATAPSVIKCGVLYRNVYCDWDKKSNPPRYSGDILGIDLVVINDNEQEKLETPDWTHIRCEWESNLKNELKYFFDHVLRLAQEHGQIRIVFGFDS